METNSQLRRACTTWPYPAAGFSPTAFTGRNSQWRGERRIRKCDLPDVLIPNGTPVPPKTSVRPSTAFRQTECNIAYFRENMNKERTSRCPNENNDLTTICHQTNGNVSKLSRAWCNYSRATTLSKLANLCNIQKNNSDATYSAFYATELFHESSPQDSLLSRGRSEGGWNFIANFMTSRSVDRSNRRWLSWGQTEERRPL